ncbi:hypothetical protein NDU88_001062 [Pleurodeles waltl]|uniref:Uncharacterized protein n=1 Tax=Pleurodeles waltl TaxID=8319 RepID=A0AAV7LET7_PLEWA|nr:hypothetical protein NDU88_001062 [Pleurodeles waltl]
MKKDIESQELGGRGLAAEENGCLRGKLRAPGWFRASAGELFFITNLRYVLSVPWNGGNPRLRTAAMATPGIGSGVAYRDMPSRSLARVARLGARARTGKTEDAAAPTPHI